MTKKLIIALFLIIFSNIAVAYSFDRPTPYYYDNIKKENIKVNMSFIDQFENYAPDYLKDRLSVEFTTRKSSKIGLANCHSLNGFIEITMFRESWIDYDYELTEQILIHELRHAYQCIILYEYPHHEDSFYYINLWREK